MVFSTTSPSKASKKKYSKTSSDDLKALDDKWPHRFARLEAMLMAKSFSVPVELLKQTSAIVTTERPFIPPVQSFTGTSSVQTTGVVT